MYETIGRYKLDSIVGRGAMGLVYRAKDPDIDRFVAIKVLNLNSKSIKFSKEAAFEAFKREAKAAGALVHPNIVTIFEVNFEHDPPYIVMQYVEGVALSKLIAQQKMLSINDILSIVEQVADALDYAHTKRIFHRDIKPANILYTAEKRPLILDFGVAAVGALQKSKYIVGTIGYMAPEQMLNLQIDGAADQFSLAVTTYELLCGKKPYQGSEIKDLLSEISKGMYISISQHRSDLPAEVDLILKRALDYDSSKRFPSCVEFAKELTCCFSAVKLQDFSFQVGRNDSSLNIAKILEEERQRLIKELELERITPNFRNKKLILVFGLIILVISFVFLAYFVVEPLYTKVPAPPIPKIDLEYDLYQKSSDDLIRIISSPDSSSEDVLLAIEEALNRMPADLIKALTVAANNPNTEIKISAIRALGRIKSFEAESVLIYKLTDPDTKVRAEAVTVLSSINARRAKDFLHYLARYDPDPNVRERAKVALNLIK